MTTTQPRMMTALFCAMLAALKNGRDVVEYTRMFHLHPETETMAPLFARVFEMHRV